MKNTYRKYISLFLTSFMLINILSTFSVVAKQSKATGMDVNISFYEYDGVNKGDKITYDRLKVGDQIISVVELDNLTSFATEGIFSFAVGIEYDSAFLRNTLLADEPSQGQKLEINNLDNTIFSKVVDTKLNSTAYAKRASDTPLEGTRRLLTLTYVYNENTFNKDSVLNGNDKKTIIALPLYLKVRPTNGQTTISMKRTAPSLQATVIDSINNGKPVTSNKTASEVASDIVVGEKTFYIDDFTGAVPENITDTNPEDGIRTVTVNNLKGLPNIPKDTTIKIYAPDGTTLLGQGTTTQAGPITITLNRQNNNDAYNSMLNLGGIIKISAQQKGFNETEKVPHMLNKRPNKITNNVDVGKLADVYVNSSINWISTLVNKVPVTYNPITGSENNDLFASVDVDVWTFAPGMDTSTPGNDKKVSGTFAPKTDNIINPDNRKANGTVDVISVSSFKPIQDIIISADHPNNKFDKLPELLPGIIIGIVNGQETNIPGVDWEYVPKNPGGTLESEFNPKGDRYDFISNVTDTNGNKATITIIVKPVTGKLPNIPPIVEVPVDTPIKDIDDLINGGYLPGGGNLDLSGNDFGNNSSFDIIWKPNFPWGDFDTSKPDREYTFIGTIILRDPWVSYDGPYTIQITIKISGKNNGINPQTRDNSIIAIITVLFVGALIGITIFSKKRKSKPIDTISEFDNNINDNIDSDNTDDNI